MRVLPAIKSYPKEMMHLVDKPLVQCGVEPYIPRNIEEGIIIAEKHKRAIEEVLENEIQRYGIIDGTLKGKVHEINDLYRKP